MENADKVFSVAFEKTRALKKPKPATPKANFGKRMRVSQSISTRGSSSINEGLQVSEKAEKRQINQTITDNTK